MLEDRKRQFLNNNSDFCVCLPQDLPDFKEIEKMYATMDAWGLVTSIDAKDCSPELIRSKEAIQQYVIELCDLIDMKRFGDTNIVHFGEDDRVAGYSMVQLIETSLIGGHFANETNRAYIDIFSCKIYNPHQAIEFTQKFFKASSCGASILFRE